LATLLLAMNLETEANSVQELMVDVVQRVEHQERDRQEEKADLQRRLLNSSFVDTELNDQSAPQQQSVEKCRFLPAMQWIPGLKMDEELHATQSNDCHSSLVSLIPVNNKDDLSSSLFENDDIDDDDVENMFPSFKWSERPVDDAGSSTVDAEDYRTTADQIAIDQDSTSYCRIQ
jgi:hypothetical protein